MNIYLEGMIFLMYWLSIIIVKFHPHIYIGNMIFHVCSIFSIDVIVKNSNFGSHSSNANIYTKFASFFMFWSVYHKYKISSK